MISVPPDVTPEEGGQYLYTMFIRGDLYNPAVDTYDSIVVDGVTYSGGGGGVLSSAFGDAQTPFFADCVAAGISDGTTNDVNYLGYAPDFITNNYVFTIVTDAPHTISINVTLNGTPTNIPLVGGVFTLTNYCATANAVDVTGTTYYHKLPNETGGLDDYRFDSIGLFTNAPAYESGIRGFFDTVSFLIGFTVAYQDNGDGTYTQTITAPSAYSYPSYVSGFDIGVINYTPC